MVHQIQHACRAGAAVYRRNRQGTEAQLCTERAHFVAEAHFAESAETVAKIAADARPIEAIIGDGIIFCVNLESGIAGTRLRRYEPLALCPERTIQLARNSI